MYKSSATVVSSGSVNSILNIEPNLYPEQIIAMIVARRMDPQMFAANRLAMPNNILAYSGMACLLHPPLTHI